MKPRVLVAEDNIDHLELLSDALSEYNEVIGTDSLEGCMQNLAEKKFDLVVLDYNLKKNFSGFDILKEINFKYPYLPVIMVTAYGNEDLAVRVMKIGAKDYIRKSLDNNYIERIVNNVNNILGKKDKENLNKVKQDIIDYFIENRASFISMWKDKIHTQEERFDIHGTEKISSEKLEPLFNAYVRDIEKNQISDTTALLKDFFSNPQIEEELFLNMELLNITFKEIAYNILSEKFPEIFDLGSTIMDQISWIVDANDLVLSKEYEKKIDSSYEAIYEFQKKRDSADLIAEMKEKLRNPLNAIAKYTLSVKRNNKVADENTISNLCENVREIEKIIDDYERDMNKKLEAYDVKFKYLK
jgi:DNA-binding response OmpR family regulator